MKMEVVIWYMIFHSIPKAHNIGPYMYIAKLESTCRQADKVSQIRVLSVHISQFTHSIEQKASNIGEGVNFP